MADPITYEVVIYDDGTAAITKLLRPTGEHEGGIPAYMGRAWRDVEATQELIAVIEGAYHGRQTENQYPGGSAPQ
jgi:hypothetical protein